jgi:hypothetical protein
MEGSDELFRALAELRPMSPREEWAERVRERCRERLARTARDARQKPRNVGFLDAATLAALALYLARVLEQVAALAAGGTPLN